MTKIFHVFTHTHAETIVRFVLSDRFIWYRSLRWSTVVSPLFRHCNRGPNFRQCVLMKRALVYLCVCVYCHGNRMTKSSINTER